MLAIPADAPHPENAHAFINFIMKPEITADDHQLPSTTPTPTSASLPLVDPEIANDPAIFPTAEVKAKLFPSVTYDARTDRMITRLWTRVRTGQ